MWKDLARRISVEFRCVATVATGPIMTTCRGCVFRAGFGVVERHTGLTRTEPVSHAGGQYARPVSFVGVADGGPASGRRQCDCRSRRGPPRPAPGLGRSGLQARIGQRRPVSRGHPGRLGARNGILDDRLGHEWSAAERRASRSDQRATGPTLLTCSLAAASGGRPGPVGSRPDVPRAPAFETSGGRAIPPS
jgi:hypothetical protein